MFLIYLLMFVLIAGSLGAITAIVVANVFPRRQKLVLRGPVVATLVLDRSRLAVRLWPTPGDTLTSDWLGNVQNRLAFCQHPLWPSRWMSAGLLASARGDWSTVGLLPRWFCRRTPRSAIWSPRPSPATFISAATAGSREAGATGAAGAVRPRRYLSPAVLLPAAADPPVDPQGPAHLPPRPGAMVAVPDLLRPARLLFSQHSAPGLRRAKPTWRNLVSFLNLSVTALILSTFTSRFIFPLLSLEGRNFWVLGLLPVRARADSLGQVRVLGRGSRWWRPRGWSF